MFLVAWTFLRVHLGYTGYWEPQVSWAGKKARWREHTYTYFWANVRLSLSGRTCGNSQEVGAVHQKCLLFITILSCVPRQGVSAKEGHLGHASFLPGLVSLSGWLTFKNMSRRAGSNGIMETEEIRWDVPETLKEEAMSCTSVNDGRKVNVPLGSFKMGRMSCKWPFNKCCSMKEWLNQRHA